MILRHVSFYDFHVIVQFLLNLPSYFFNFNTSLKVLTACESNDRLPSPSAAESAFRNFPHGYRFVGGGHIMLLYITRKSIKTRT